MFKRINYDGLLPPETDEGKTTVSKREAEEEKVRGEVVVKGTKGLKTEKSREVRKVNVDISEKIYNNILEHKSSDSYETPQVLQVKQEVLENGLTQVRSPLLFCSKLHSLIT